MTGEETMSGLHTPYCLLLTFLKGQRERVGIGAPFYQDVER